MTLTEKRDKAARKYADECPRMRDEVDFSSGWDACLKALAEMDDSYKPSDDMLKYISDETKRMLPMSFHEKERKYVEALCRSSAAFQF